MRVGDDTAAIVHSAARRRLHWAIAAVVFAALATGALTFTEAARSRSDLLWTLFAWHKSLGLLALLLTLARLASWWLRPLRRLKEQAGLSAVAATTVQVSMILVCLALPLFGLLTDAFQGGGAPIFGLSSHAWKPAADLRLSVLFGSVHGSLALLLVGLLALHLMGGFKHHFVDRDKTVRAMLRPVRAAVVPRRLSPYWLPASAVVAAAIAAPLIAARLDASQNPEPSQGDWIVDQSRSRIEIEAQAEGFDIPAEFTRFDVAARFSPENPADANLELLIWTASFISGFTVVDERVAGADWLASALDPVAVWRSGGIERLGSTRYRSLGTLTIRERSVPVAVEFDFVEKDGEAHVSGGATFDRMALGLGAETDDVSTEITVKFNFIASRKERI